MERDRNIKRIIIVFILAFGTTSMYGLPYLKFTFYDQMTEVLQLTNTEMGNLSSIFGIVSMFSYLVGGWVADRISLKILLSVPLIMAGTVGLYFSTYPAYKMLIIIFILWGFATIYYAASVKLLRIQGKKSEQARIFGVYEGIAGIAGIIISFTGLIFLEKYTNISIGFKFVIIVHSITSIICGICMMFLIEYRKEESAKSKKVSSVNIMKIIFTAKVWLIGLIIFSTFIMYASLTYLSPYLSEVYLLPIGIVSIISIIRTYGIRVIASPLAGIIADKRSSTIDVLYYGYMFMLISNIIYIIVPVKIVFTWLIIVNMAILSTLVFGFRGIYFATIEESNIPMESMGIVVGFISFIGFSPDSFYYSVVGRWLDLYGNQGYTLIFIICAACSILGIAATYKLKAINKKEMTKENTYKLETV